MPSLLHLIVRPFNSPQVIVQKLSEQEDTKAYVLPYADQVCSVVVGAEECLCGLPAEH